VERRKTLVSRSPEKELFKFQYNNVQLLPFDCFTLSTKPESMDEGKHMLDCGVTRNKQMNINMRRERPNGV